MLKTYADCESSKQNKILYKMKVSKISTSNGNALVMGAINDEVLFGYFKVNGGTFTYLRPSEQSEWDYAVQNWSTQPETIEAGIEFPYLRYFGNVLYAFHPKTQTKPGIVGRFMCHYEGNKIAYESLSLKQAIDNKYGTENKIFWIDGAGKNVQESFKEIKKYDTDERYADQFGVDKTGSICWVHFICKKPGCDCTDNWSWGDAENIAALFERN